MNSHWQFFSKAAIDPVQSPESGHWLGNAEMFELKVGCAAIPATGAGLDVLRHPASYSRPASPPKLPEAVIGLGSVSLGSAGEAQLFPLGELGDWEFPE